MKSLLLLPQLPFSEETYYFFSCWKQGMQGILVTVFVFFPTQTASVYLLNCLAATVAQKLDNL